MPRGLTSGGPIAPRRLGGWVFFSVVYAATALASASCTGSRPAGGIGSGGQTGGRAGADAATGGSGAGGKSASGGGGTAGGGAQGGSSGGTSGGTGGTATVSAPSGITGLTIEANPNNSLSCFVNWTTDVAAHSEVQFGVESYQFHIVTNEAVTSHRVLVIGLHAQTEYLIKAVSNNAGGSTRAEGRFTTGALPADLPVATATVGDTSAAQPGWTLTNIMPAGGSGGFAGTAPGIIVMYDQTGVPIWYFVNGTTNDQRGDVSLRVLGNGNIVLGPSSGEPAKEIDLAGNVVWSGPPQPAANASTSGPATSPMSHFGGKLANGNYVLLHDTTNASGIGGAYIEEVTSSNTVVWSWNLFDHLQPPAGAAKDWCHPNALTVDLESDVLYLSCRYQGIIKARRSGDKGVIWILGGLAGGDFAFSPAESGFDDQHDPEIHADGTILIYNNAGTSLKPVPGVTSRVLEFKVDETTKQATLTFEFPGGFATDAWYKTNWYTPYWGDADRLANGNVLVTAGIRSQTEQTHIFEVRPSDGAVVWQITLPLGVGSYHAERLSPPPLVQPL